MTFSMAESAAWISWEAVIWDKTLKIEETPLFLKCIFLAFFKCSETWAKTALSALTYKKEDWKEAVKRSLTLWMIAI
jgi:hypothetical protein